MFDIEGSSFSRWCIGLEGQLCPYHCQQKDLTKSYLFFFSAWESQQAEEGTLWACAGGYDDASPGGRVLTGRGMTHLMVDPESINPTVCEFGFLFTRGCLDFLILDPFPASDILKPNRLPFLFIYLCLIEFFVSRLSSGMKRSCLTGYSGFWEEINGYWICSC